MSFPLLLFLFFLNKKKPFTTSSFSQAICFHMSLSPSVWTFCNLQKKQLTLFQVTCTVVATKPPQFSRLSFTHWFCYNGRGKENTRGQGFRVTLSLLWLPSDSWFIWETSCSPPLCQGSTGLGALHLHPGISTPREWGKLHSYMFQELGGGGMISLSVFCWCEADGIYFSSHF